MTHDSPFVSPRQPRGELSRSIAVTEKASVAWFTLFIYDTSPTTRRAMETAAVTAVWCPQERGDRAAVGRRGALRLVLRWSRRRRGDTRGASCGRRPDSTPSPRCASPRDRPATAAATVVVTRRRLTGGTVATTRARLRVRSVDAGRRAQVVQAEGPQEQGHREEPGPGARHAPVGLQPARQGIAEFV